MIYRQAWQYHVQRKSGPFYREVLYHRASHTCNMVMDDRVSEDDGGLTVDLACRREFPSLSGAARAQQQVSASQAKWGNPGLRSASDNLAPRSSQSQTQRQALPSRSTPQSSHGSSDQAQDPDGRASPFSQLPPGGEHYRFGEAVQSRESDGRSNTRRSTDDFPPLGGLGGGPGDIGQGRRTGPVGNVNGSAFGATSTPSRAQTLDNSAAPGARLSSPPGISSRGMVDVPKDVSTMIDPGFSNADIKHLARQCTFRFRRHAIRAKRESTEKSTFLQWPAQLMDLDLQGSSSIMGLDHAFGAGEVRQASSSMASPRADGGRLQMSELDRFGLAGLLATLREGESSDQTHLALGMNLNSLGLDLHRPEYVACE